VALTGFTVLVALGIGLLLSLAYFVRKERDDEAAQAATMRAEERFRVLTEQSSDLVFAIGATGLITYAAPSSERLFGTAAQPVVGLPLIQFAHGEDAGRLQQFISDLSRSPFPPKAFECRLVTGRGEVVEVEMTGRNLLGRNGVEAMVLNGRDVTERNRTAERLRYEALHDRLTGLPNRALVLERVESALMQSIATQTPQAFAVVYLDLDGFKSVNDVFGHAAGDTLLKLVTERLTRTLRIPGRNVPASPQGPLRPPPSDTLARIGGDEFVVLLQHIDTPRSALLVANRIEEALRSPFEIEHHDVRIGSSIGISLGPQQYRSADEMLRDADIAMYRAKKSGQARPQLFDQAMHEVVASRLSLENDLRAAIAQDQFLLHFQPIVSASDRSLHGFEALLRWQHPTRGLLPAAEFIEMAESVRLILPLGRWMLRAACLQVAQWLRRFPNLPEGVMSVNLSALEVLQPDTLSYLRGVLAETGVLPRHLRLELTESVAMRDADAAVAWCKSVRGEGALVGLDDFGTGYSSLGYLSRLEVDFLKIDRILVQGASASTRAADVLDATVAIAQNLKLGVVFEGVETDEQASVAQTAKGALLQGYGIARPMPAADTTAWLQEMRKPEAAARAALWQPQVVRGLRGA
jgi:PAS domain S-box-containing protein